MSERDEQLWAECLKEAEDFLGENELEHIGEDIVEYAGPEIIDVKTLQEVVARALYNERSRNPWIDIDELPYPVEGLFLLAEKDGIISPGHYRPSYEQGGPFDGYLTEWERVDEDGPLVPAGHVGHYMPIPEKR